MEAPPGASTPEHTREPSMTRRAWVLLWLYLPLAKGALLFLAPQTGPALRLAVMYGGGLALAALPLGQRRERRILGCLLRRPLKGMAVGVVAYVALALAATGIVRVQGLVASGVVTAPLVWLAQWFDLSTLPERLGGPAPGALAGWAAFVALATVAEEWLFRSVLLWRWVAVDEADGLEIHLGVHSAWKLAAVSLYFAALHWPQPPAAVLIALLGGLVAGALLLWRRNFALVATLHVLFNWNAML